jgi:fatty acid desaturase
MTLEILSIAVGFLMLWWLADLRGSARNSQRMGDRARANEMTTLLFGLAFLLLGPSGNGIKFAAASAVAAVILAPLVLYNLWMGMIAVYYAPVLGYQLLPRSRTLAGILRDLVLVALAVSIAVGRFMAL